MPTTRQEGLPLTILEGMAYGLATIASDIGGIPGVITNDVDGILVRPNNQQELDQAFENLLGNEQLIDSISKSARQTIEQRYSKQRMVDDTLEVLHSTIKN
jgi:glycosyltransferase involved in cell wall biosynthesis